MLKHMVATVDFRGVELCRAGEWNGLTGKARVTPEDLQSVVAAYSDTEVDRARVKLGHVSELNALGDGAPAFGWIENPRLGADGKTLLGDLVDVPRKLGEVVGKAYRNVSVELRKNVTTPSGKKHRTVLSGLALLGASAPAVKGLDDLAALYASEAPGGGPEDDCTASETVTIELGDALSVTPDENHHTTKDVADPSKNSPDVPGPNTEEGPTVAFLEQAREKLGLPADATEDDILAKLGTTNLSEHEGEGSTLDQETEAQETDTTEGDAPETVRVSKAQWDDVTARLARLDQESKAQHQEKVLEAALSEGRIVPAERDKWSVALSAAPEATEVLLSQLAPRVNMSETGSDVALSAGDQADDAAFQAWADRVGF